MNIERIKIEEKLRQSNLKYRGDPIKISEDTGYPLVFVVKNLAKIRKKEKRNYSDVSIIIANSITKTIIEGYHQRVKYYEDMLESLEGRDQNLVSSCCSFTFNENNDKTFTCLRCNKICNTAVVDHLAIYELKNTILNSIKEESVALVTFADRMGYTFKDPDNLVKIQKNYVVFQQNNVKEQPKKVVQSQQSELIGDDVVIDISSMKGLDAEVTIKQLEKYLKDVDDEATTNKDNEAQS